MPWYFAYGSNMQTGTLRERRGVRYTRAVAGRVSGWRLVFDKPGLLPTGESFANIIPDPPAEVYGVLFEVSDADLHHIDLTEGVLIGNYWRIEVPVVALHEPDATSSAFTLTSDRRGLGVMPSVRYMGLLVEGALEHGLPVDYIELLRKIPARAESEDAVRLRPMVDAFMKRR